MTVSNKARDDHDRIVLALHNLAALATDLAHAFEGRRPPLEQKSEAVKADVGWLESILDGDRGWFAVLVERVGFEQATGIAKTIKGAVDGAAMLDTIGTLAYSVTIDHSVWSGPDLLEDLDKLARDLEASGLENPPTAVDLYVHETGLSREQASLELIRMRRETPLIRAEQDRWIAEQERRQEEQLRERYGKGDEVG